MDQTVDRIAMTVVLFMMTVVLIKTMVGLVLTIDTTTNVSTKVTRNVEESDAKRIATVDATAYDERPQPAIVIMRLLRVHQLSAQQ